MLSTEAASTNPRTAAATATPGVRGCGACPGQNCDIVPYPRLTRPDVRRWEASMREGHEPVNAAHRRPPADDTALHGAGPVLLAQPIGSSVDAPRSGRQPPGTAEAGGDDTGRHLCR
ncbi:hypothetical protein GCM10011381_26850 [Klenkia taihuensis]|nr:hypothetical protein GCM10011381_26850 [Klenkia taihuensis]